jgi:hypothetical protein
VAVAIANHTKNVDITMRNCVIIVIIYEGLPCLYKRSIQEHKDIVVSASVNVIMSVMDIAKNVTHIVNKGGIYYLGNNFEILPSLQISLNLHLTILKISKRRNRSKHVVYAKKIK